MSRKLLTAALCTIAALAPLTAQADDNRIYVSGMFQYTMYDDSKQLEHDLGGIQLGLGLPFSEKLVLELTYLDRTADLRSTGMVDQNGFGLDALMFFQGRDGRFDPYLALGYGQLTDDDFTTERDYGSVQAALGFVNDFNDSFAFRGEMRVYKNDDSDRSTDLAIGIGALYRFGAKPQSMAAPAPMAAPVPAPAPVAAVAAVPVAAAIADPDSDGDGVKDSVDRCPGTPAGRAVGADGCELDSDGDGVLDSADKCPGTPAGTAVLANGCEVPKVVKLEGVTFTSGTANFVPGASAKLNLAVQALKDNPTIAVEVSGHTDAQGDANANRALSQRRADAVRKYLLDGGVAADQVTARGYGEDEPTASNDTAEGRALNRRVELRTKL